MKTLAIVLILAFAAPAFASDLGLISIMESNGKTIALYYTPEPVKSEKPKTEGFNARKFFAPFSNYNIGDWAGFILLP